MSCLNPMRSSVLFASGRHGSRMELRRSKAAPKGGLRLFTPLQWKETSLLTSLPIE
jgi:hypothetical protein